MTTFARVPTVPGNVAEIYIGDSLFPMHPIIAATWYQAPTGTLEGYTYDGTNFTAPVAPTPPSPTPAQQAAAALGEGIQLTSTSTPLLNGTYSTSASSIANVNAVTTYILLNGTFPGGATEFPWYDMGGSQHTFPSLTEFKAFATTFATYVAAVSLYADSNGVVGPLPSNQITIA